MDKTFRMVAVDMAKQHAAPVVCANAPRRLVALVGRSGPAALGSLPDSSRAHLPPLPLHPPSDKYAAKVQRELAAAAAAIRAATAEGSSEGPEVERAPSSDASRGAVATARSREEESQIAPDREQDSGRVECPASGMSAQSDFVAAQGVWDATMAHSIAEVLRKRPGAAVMHVCGRFHCEDRLGIPEHLSRYAPTARVVCVMSIAARDGAVELSREEFMREIHRDGLADFVCVTAGSVSTSVGAS